MGEKKKPTLLRKLLILRIKSNDVGKDNEEKQTEKIRRVFRVFKRNKNVSFSPEHYFKGESTAHQRELQWGPV